MGIPIAARRALLPLARTWLRYGPVPFGKQPVWNRIHWLDHDFVCRTRFGATMSGTTVDIIQRYLYYFGVWEPEITRVVAERLKPGDTFIDVGANIGYYTLLASRLVGPRGRVVAFEPSPAILPLLQRHLEINRVGNARVVAAAVSDREGVLKLYPGGAANIGHTSLFEGVGEPFDVRVAPLPQMLSDDEVRRARLIKIDVEGAERDVVAGLAPMLPRLRDDAELLLEVSARQMPGGAAAVADIFRILQEHGFRGRRMHNDYDASSYMRMRPAPELPPIDAASPGLELADVLFTRERG